MSFNSQTNVCASDSSHARRASLEYLRSPVHGLNVAFRNPWTWPRRGNQAGILDDFCDQVMKKQFVTVSFLLALVVIVDAAGYTTSFPLSENPISEGGTWTNGG